MKVKINSPLVLGFVGVCFCIMLFNTLTGGRSYTLFSVGHFSFGAPLTYLQLFLHVLGHADWAHFFSNMLYVLLLGPLLEEKYGGKHLIQVILITALFSGLIHCILFWNTVLCGASSICFAFIVLSSFTEFKDGEIPLTVIIVAAIFIGQQIYQGIIIEDNISNISHITGGIIGGVSGFVLNKR